jgi:hypothetical protein
MVELGGGSIGYIADQWEYDEIEVEPNDYLTNEKWLLDTKQMYIKMDAMISHKEKLNAIYRDMLPASIQLPAQYQHWRFNILTDKKEQILQALFAENLFASGHYESQCENCSVASNLNRYIINLFNDGYITVEQAKNICDIINKQLG